MLKFLRVFFQNWRIASIFCTALLLAACDRVATGANEDDGTDLESGEYERGPNGGRMLEAGDFAVEVTIFETGTPPRFRLYPYDNGKPVAPQDIAATIELGRLGGNFDRFEFSPEGDYLTSPSTVVEPHSFDVIVEAGFDGQTYEWTYESYEGRTTISNAAANEAGVVIEQAGPAVIEETVDVLGRVDFAPGAEAVLRGRFAGQVLEVLKTVGDRVAKDEVIARVESNESLQSYDIKSPIGGVLIDRQTNPGDVVGEAPLFVIGDVSNLIVDFHVFASDLEQVAPGQRVQIKSIDGGSIAESSISTFLPTKETATQTIIARAPLTNPEGIWIPGMTVRGDITVNTIDAPLAVRSDALQRFRDFSVVFEKIDETYEVRMLEIGRQNVEWVEVLGGLEPGANYVAKNSYLIKADIEKSGASHDH